MTTNSEAPVPTTPVPTVWPAFRARDARALIAFLVDAFGFEETLVVPGEGDLVAHAQLSWPHGGGVMLGSERPGTGWHVGAGGAGCYVVVPDDAALDAVRARARAAGADAGDVVKQGYGSREFTVRDPEGNHWSFGTYRGEPRV
ncbi:VOC family protein [Kineococcus endophyticus]|uniref:VOC family protein n=1 Tax=Kineococcus endophyticus TaxID=1181883 RepID=A0ABV3P7K7_9ACTN